MIGGFHTTGTYMTWFFYFLAQRPDIQRKVREEVRRVREEEGFKTIHDMKKLVYTRRVMNETLRFGKIGLFSERQAERDTEIGGFVISKGSQILNALAITLDDPETFPNPGEFDPEGNFPEHKNHGMAYKKGRGYCLKVTSPLVDLWYEFWQQIHRIGREHVTLRWVPSHQKWHPNENWETRRQLCPPLHLIPKMKFIIEHF